MLTEMHSGRSVDPFALEPEDIDLGDIAYHLSGIYRYNGATRLTVAQHCVLGAQKIIEDTGNINAAAGFLLHDAPEAYLMDMTNPVKEGISNVYPEFMEWYLGVHRKYFKMIVEKFGVLLTNDESELISEYDRRILCDEAEALFGHELAEWNPLGIEIKWWGTEWARHEYLVMAEKTFVKF